MTKKFLIALGEIAAVLFIFLAPLFLAHVFG